jgi:hypothetical protein
MYADYLRGHLTVQKKKIPAGAGIKSFGLLACD